VVPPQKCTLLSSLSPALTTYTQSESFYNQGRSLSLPLPPLKADYVRQFHPAPFRPGDFGPPFFLFFFTSRFFLSPLGRAVWTSPSLEVILSCFPTGEPTIIIFSNDTSSGFHHPHVYPIGFFVPPYLKTPTCSRNRHPISKKSPDGQRSPKGSQFFPAFPPPFLPTVWISASLGPLPCYFPFYLFFFFVDGLVGPPVCRERPVIPFHIGCSSLPLPDSLSSSVDTFKSHPPSRTLPHSSRLFDVDRVVRSSPPCDFPLYAEIPMQEIFPFPSPGYCGPFSSGLSIFGPSDSTKNRPFYRLSPFAFRPPDVILPAPPSPPTALS